MLIKQFLQRSRAPLFNNFSGSQFLFPAQNLLWNQMNMFSTQQVARAMDNETTIDISSDQPKSPKPKRTKKVSKKNFSQNELGIYNPNDKKVHLYPHKRDTFYKLGYNENHIPITKRQEKQKKQKLDQWENPQYSWPPYLPRPTMHRGKTLLAEVEKEYLNKIKTERPFKVPNYRSGDVVDVTVFQSLSEGKFNKHRGVIIGTEKPNKLTKAFTLHFNEAEMNLSMKVKEFSPLLAKMDVVRYGSNQNRKKLTYLHDLDLSKTRTEEPVIKGRDFKARVKKQDAGKIVDTEVEKGKIKRETTKLESSYDD